MALSSCSVFKKDDPAPAEDPYAAANPYAAGAAGTQNQGYPAYGNTGAASVYVALEEAWSTGRLKSGDLVLLAAFGGGFTWGAALLRW